MRTNQIPTDRQILQWIYDTYYQAFTSREPKRDAVLYVPIDIDRMGTHFSIDPQLLFGRLNHDLQKKHGYELESGSHVPFFTPVAGKDRNCVHFPLLASVLANLQQETRRYWLSLTLSIVALIVAGASFGVSLLKLVVGGD